MTQMSFLFLVYLEVHLEAEALLECWGCPVPPIVVKAATSVATAEGCTLKLFWGSLVSIRHHLETWAGTAPGRTTPAPPWWSLLCRRIQKVYACVKLLLEKLVNAPDVWR